MQRRAVHRGVQQVAVQLGVVFDIHLLLSALYLVERRLCDVDVAALDQFVHLSIEKGQQQRPDVRAVDVCVGHDDDAVVAQLVGIEIIAADTAAERGNQRSHLGRRQHLVETCFLDVQDLSLQRKNGLCSPVTALLRGSSGRIALDEKKLRQRGVFFLAVGQLPGKTGDVQRAFAARHLARFAGSLPGPGGIDNLRGDGFCVLWVFEQVFLEFGRHRLLDDAFNFR